VFDLTPDTVSNPSTCPVFLEADVNYSDDEGHSRVCHYWFVDPTLQHNGETESRSAGQDNPRSWVNPATDLSTCTGAIGESFHLAETSVMQLIYIYIYIYIYTMPSPRNRIHTGTETPWKPKIL
jgi:hypothetical protein